MKKIIIATSLLINLYVSAVDNNLIEELITHNIVKKGSFTLKNGIESDIYVDMRAAISFPHLFHKITMLMQNTCQYLTYDKICAVPYGALPFATSLAMSNNKPLIMLRKEAKNYGTKKIIEGIYNHDDRILLIEDVITTGSSILEAIAILEQNGLIVHDIIVLFDRQQGGTEKLQELGYHVHPIFALSELEEYQSSSQNHKNYQSMSYQGYIDGTFPNSIAL